MKDFQLIAIVAVAYLALKNLPNFKKKTDKNPRRYGREQRPSDDGFEEPMDKKQMSRLDEPSDAKYVAYRLPPHPDQFYSPVFREADVLPGWATAGKSSPLVYTRDGYLNERDMNKP